MKMLYGAVLALNLVLAGAAAAAQQTPAPQKLSLDISPRPISDALNECAHQAGLQVVFYTQIAKGLTSPQLKGDFTPDDAFTRLLAGTGLKHRFLDDKTVMVISARDEGGKPTAGTSPIAALTLAQADQNSMQKVEGVDSNTSEAANKKGAEGSSEPEALDDESTKGIPEILVRSKKTLNMDMKRTEDDPQPYVVFGAEEIQRSQAVNLEEFLRTRLPMNTSSDSYTQVSGSSTTSGINLRGLGTNQTLMLVDGRRVPGVASFGFPYQPDINGIPLSAIERIEVLSSTASGIYGGSATGGVINIILRRDFRGIDAKATYANTFDSDTGSLRFDVNAGFNLEGGRTRVMIAAAHTDTNKLLAGDRDFAQRAIARTLGNNPAAITGSNLPPLGATVNIATPGVFDLATYLNTGEITYLPGPDLTLKPGYGSVALGSNITHVPLGYAGPDSDNGAALVRNAGTYSLDLSNDVNGRGRGLVAAPSMESVSLNVRREFNERLEGFLDLSTQANKGATIGGSAPNSVTLPATAPNNPFDQDIIVRFPTPGLSFEDRSESTTVRVTAGLIARLAHGWTGEIDYGWSRSRFKASGVNTSVDAAGVEALATGLPAADGRPALNVLQEGNTSPLDFTPYLLPAPNRFDGPNDTILRDATLRFSGPTMNLPGGPLSLSMLLEHRQEQLQDGFFSTIDATSREPEYYFNPHLSQDADSCYLEARAPLLSSANALPWARELELQASLRRDEYKTHSVPFSGGIPVDSTDGPFPVQEYTTNQVRSTDYTVGLRYSPVEDLTVRASFGTGFLPPAVYQIASTPLLFDFPFGLTDPKRGNTDTYVGEPWTYINGGNPDLQPEESQSWSAGLILTPRFAPGLRLSIDFTAIDKVDEIQTPGNQFVINNEDAFPGRVVRGANLPGDPVGWAGPITSLDVTYVNVASTSVQAYDIQADYVWETQRAGRFRAYALASWERRYRNRLLTSDPATDSVGFRDGPLEWRGNMGVDWSRGPLAVSWNMQYYDSYFIYFSSDSMTSRASRALTQGSSTIPSQMYHDLIATWRFDAGFLAGTDFSIGIQNLLDKSPPILGATGTTSTYYSTYGDPRLRRYTLSVRRSFQ